MGDVIRLSFKAIEWALNKHPRFEQLKRVVKHTDSACTPATSKRDLYLHALEGAPRPIQEEKDGT